MLKEVMQISMLEEKKKQGELNFNFKKQPQQQQPMEGTTLPVPDLPPLPAKRDLVPLKVGGRKKSSLIQLGHGIHDQTLSLHEQTNNTMIPSRSQIPLPVLRFV